MTFEKSAQDNWQIWPPRQFYSAPGKASQLEAVWADAVGQACSPSVALAGVIRLIAVPHEYSPVTLSSELYGGEQQQP